MNVRRILLAFAVIALGNARSVAFAQTDPRVGTLAGNGIAGNVDARAGDAEFMDPVGVAYEPGSGAIDVADFAGQRIRRIAADGNVTTLAGSGATLPSGLSVDGGYLDGPAQSARFNGPSGIASAPDGSVIVADALNHCIRSIHDGNVATLAGSPERIGSIDGPLAQASFTYPRSVAVSNTGTIYVADYTVGVRVVGTDGVTTLPVPDPYGKAVTNLAFLDGPHPLLFGAVRSGIWRYDLQTHAFAIFTTSHRHPAAFAPFGIAPLDASSVVASSVIFDALYLATYAGYHGFADERSLQIAGIDEKDQNFVGGFREDAPLDSAFYSPMGLARDAAGDVIVADAGNRRIRIIPATVVSAARP